MKSKTEKILKIGAVCLFIFALFLNVNLSLNDPFNTISEIAIASVTTDSGTEIGTGGNKVLCYSSCTFSLIKSFYDCGNCCAMLGRPEGSTLECVHISDNC